MVYSFDDIHYFVTQAYIKAREHERSTIAQIQFEMDLEVNIKTLALELYRKQWSPGPLDWFINVEPTVREIFAPQFRDRVVSHVLFNLLYPIFERYFIYDSYSCRINKGTLFGIHRLEHHIKSVTNNYTKEAWCLNYDITGYFMSINRSKLYDIVWYTLNKYISKYPNELDSDFIDYLLKCLLHRDPLEGCIYRGDPNKINLVLPEKSLRFQKPGIGIPIGDVVNQLFSNIYLNVFDQFVKRKLKIKHYVRYVDDGKILHNSYDYLLWCKEESNKFLTQELGLKLHPNKTTITSVYNDIYFLGGVLRPYRIHSENRAKCKFRKYINNLDYLLKENIDIDLDTELLKLNSRLGYLKNFKELKSEVKILMSAPHVRDRFKFTWNLNKAFINQK